MIARGYMATAADMSSPVHVFGTLTAAMVMFAWDCTATARLLASFGVSRDLLDAVVAAVVVFAYGYIAEAGIVRLFVWLVSFSAWWQPR